MAIPPRLLFTEMESTAGDTVNVPVYLPPPALERVPMRAPVPAFHTVTDAVVLVLVASTFNWNERTASSAFVICTVSRGRRTVNAAVWETPAREAETETAVSLATGCNVMGKVAVVAPGATVTLAGTEATEELDMDK